MEEKKEFIIHFLRVLLVAITVYLIIHQDFLFAFAALISAIIAFIPEVIKIEYKISIP